MLELPSPRAVEHRNWSRKAAEDRSGRAGVPGIWALEGPRIGAIEDWSNQGLDRLCAAVADRLRRLAPESPAAEKPITKAERQE